MTGALYGAADTNGKTWPTDPVKTVAAANGTAIKAKFEGWYTAADGGSKIESTSTVSISANDGNVSNNTVTLYAHYAAVDTAVSTVNTALRMNANHYTMESMQAVDTQLAAIFGSAEGVRNADAATLQTVLNNLVVLEEDDGAPQVSVFENKTVIGDELEQHTYDDSVSTLVDSSSTGGVSYVMPGKAYYTYYCYTNSTHPVILVNTAETSDGNANSRVSYPTKVTMSADTNSSSQVRTRSGLVRSGWMNYTQDGPSEEVRKADWTSGSRTLTTNPYAGKLTYFGSYHNNQSGYGYYKQEQYVTLTPTFVDQGGVKQYALYTFTVTDDSYGATAADTVSLAGAANYGSYATAITDNGYAEVTPEHTITIFVEYYNTMNGSRTDNIGQVVDANGVGKAGGGKLEVYNNFTENGYKTGKWNKVDYLYRNAAGAATNEFIAPLTATNGTYSSYLANDPIYGQNDIGSFYYLMKSTDNATALYWSAYDAYLAVDGQETDYAGARVAGWNNAKNAITTQVTNDLSDSKVRDKMLSMPTQAVNAQNGDYISWPYTTNTQWSTQFYAPAKTRDDTLVYVHIYDRWGNTYTNILQRNLQDIEAPTGSSPARGEAVINETGGSGLKEVKITEYAKGGSGKMLPALQGMTDGSLTWNAPDHQFTVTGLPKGNNNYVYSMYICDNAGHDGTFNFRASADGSVVITVNDETMGGSYAQAAAAPAPETTDPADLIGAGAIDQGELTTLSVEEVQPDVIAANTIEEAQIVGSAAEEDRPDLYTFMLNEIYTVNLFADTGEYEMTLKSTTGGIVKAYVNGEFAPAKAGKVTVPGGSQVQIRVSAKAGYELQSLTMTYADGRTVDLVGAYNAEINSDVTVKAIFTSTNAKLRIRVENGAVSGKQELLVSPYSRVTAVAEAAPEGKVFAYWAQNGADDVPVSYDAVYMFIATSDVDLKAIYADEPVAQTASIVMDAASPTHVTVVNGANTLSYSGRITIPEGAQIEEFGMVLTNQSAADCTAENFVIGGQVNGKNVVKVTGKTLTEEGQCKININNVASGQTRTGRLFLTVKLADGTTQTIYSNTWSELTTA